MKKKHFEKIELVFTENKNMQEQKFTLQKNAINEFVTTVDEIKDWFKLYDIASIDLWISGAVQSGSILRLILSASGQGGIMITLKPKT